MFICVSVVLTIWCIFSVRNAGVEVDWMDRRVISSVVLEAEDLDTPTSKLYYILTAGPRFGKLQVKVSAKQSPSSNDTQKGFISKYV